MGSQDLTQGGADGRRWLVWPTGLPWAEGHVNVCSHLCSCVEGEGIRLRAKDGFRLRVRVKVRL